MLLSTSCPICHHPGSAPCAECAELFIPPGSVEPPPAALDALFGAMVYADAARPLITALKYRNQRGAVGWVADAMVTVLELDARPDVVTWAPTTPARRRDRGFDQAELLARAVARRIGVRPRRLLMRRGGDSQTGRGGADRRHHGPVFALTPRTIPASVLLIDDVATTGTTLTAAATALRRGGAHRVTGLVAAVTPPPDDPSY